jgi:hypothetical protein
MAVSFDEAAGLIADRPFDCITVDLSLGERDGIEVPRLIGELRPTPNVVVISGCDTRILKFNMKVVAEGIEDEETWHALAVVGCDLGQGFVISAGLTEQDFFDWATRWQGPPPQSRSRGARSQLSGV